MYLPSSLLPSPSHQPPPPPPPPRPSPLPSSFHMSSEGSGWVFFFTLRTFRSNFQHRTNLSPVCSQESNIISKLLVQYINRCSLLCFCAHKLSKNTICETIKLRITGFLFFPALKNSFRTCHHEVKRRIASWLQARKELWSNYERTQSSESRMFLCKKDELLLKPGSHV